MLPSHRGAIAETAITARAVELGIGVYRPVSDGGRADLIFDLGSRLHRVQCKWCRTEKGAVIVRAITCRRGPGGYVRGTYSAHEIDAIAAYCHELRQVFYIPFADFAGRCTMQLRLRPARNNQRIGVHFAEQYDLGAIAQLGERLRGTQEVAGSSPASSIDNVRPLF